MVPTKTAVPIAAPPRPSALRRARGWLVLVALIAGGTAALYVASTRTKPVFVRTAAVARGRVEETVSSTKAGSIRSRAAASLSADATGSIVALPAREGANVKKGDLLLRVDAREAEAALATARWQLRVLEALVREARSAWLDATRERDRLRSAGDAITKLQMDQAEARAEARAATLSAAESRLEEQKSAIRRAEVAVEKCELRAPFDGVVTERYVEVGEWAAPGRTVLRIVALDRTYVRAEIDEVDLGKLRTGLVARVTLDPYKDLRLAGRLARISPHVFELQEQNRTVEVEVELSDVPPDVQLKPGTSADVELIVRERPDALRLPTTALMAGDRVLVAGPDGRARARSVSIGLRNWEFAEVLSGLEPGERVITSLESEAVKADVAIVEEAP